MSLYTTPTVFHLASVLVVSALALAPRIKYCTARGPAPQVT